jgi:hypothetical protein
MTDYSGESARFSFACFICGKPKCAHDQDYCGDCADELEREAESDWPNTDNHEARTDRSDT